MERIMDAIRAVRSRRADMNVAPSRKAKVIVATAEGETFAAGAPYIERLAGASDLVGVMLESHLFDGCQALGGELRYGVSITDGCLGWEGTERILRDAARRLAERR